MSRSVQIVLFDGFDPLDVIAPFEVFVAGSEYFLDCQFGSAGSRLDSVVPAGAV